MKKGIIAGFVVMLLAAAGAVWAFGGFAASGLTPPKAAEINNASIIIGTYLIDFAVLNEENQALAEDNAASSSQSKVYYKSDINKGVWYDITDAENVADISLKNSKIVPNSVIDGLNITMYFKADGTIIDYANNRTTTAQDILTTVYPANMTELGNLVQQKSILESLLDSEEDDDKWDIYNAEMKGVNSVLEVIDNDIVRGYAKELAALDKSIKTLKTQQAVDAVVTVKLKKEAEHDIYCYSVVVDRLNAAVESLGRADMTAHSELISTMNDIITELNGTISDLSSTAGGGDSSSDDAKQALADEITAAAIAGDASALNAAAEKLELLDALINGEECDDYAAAELLEGMLDDLTANITSEVEAIFDNSHSFYTDDSETKPTSDEAVSAINQKIGDAERYIEDIANRLTGSADGDEANKLKAEKLSALGTVLEQLSANDATDSLQKKLIAVLAEKSAEVLDNAAEAEALASSALATELSDIDAIEAKADAKYEEYIGALEKGDATLAATLKKELDKLNEQLDAARGNADIAALYTALMDAKENAANNPADKDAAKTLREAKSALTAAEKTLSATDSLLIGELDAALSELDDALSSGSGETARECLANIKNAMANLDANLLGDSAKSKILGFAATALDKAAKDSAANGDSYNANALAALSEDAAGLSRDALSGALGTDADRSADGKALSALITAKGKANAAKKSADNAEKKLADLNAILSAETAKLSEEQKALLDSVNACVARVEGGGDSTVRSACTELSTLLAGADSEVFGAEARNALIDYLDKLIDGTGGADALLSDAKKALETIKISGGAASGSAADELLAAVFNAKGALSDAKKNEADAEAALSGAAGTLGADTKALTNALTALENAAGSLDAKGVGTAYEALQKALNNLPSETLDEAARADITDYAETVVNDAAENARGNGDSETADSLQNALDSGKSDESVPTADVIGGELYAYKLIAADYGIYSNSMTLTVGKTTYIKILDAARAAGSSVITADKVYVVKGENILIEFTVGSTTAYVGDKLYALAAAPFESDGSVYAPIDLFAKGYSLTLTSENGTIFLRKD